MTKYAFRITIRRDSPDEDYWVHSPTLPGCYSRGKTVQEARTNMREAIELHLEGLLAHGESVPQDDPSAVDEILEVAV